METGTRVLLLTAVLAALPGCATVRGWFDHGTQPSAPTGAASSPVSAPETQEENAPPRVVEPEVARRQIKVPKVRSSNIELGAFYGVLSIEDFGANPVYGISATYHVTEDFFFQADVGRSHGGLTSFESLSGSLRLLTESERRFTYYDVTVGYNFLPGEGFLGRGRAMTNAFYLLGGIGATDFAGDTKFTVNFGAGYRIVPADWLAVHVTVQDRMFQSSLLGTTKLTNNLEAYLAATIFF